MIRRKGEEGNSTRLLMLYKGTETFECFDSGYDGQLQGFVSENEVCILPPFLFPTSSYPPLPRLLFPHFFSHHVFAALLPGRFRGHAVPRVSCQR